MNVWLIMSGEPLEEFGERPHRIGLLSKILQKKGHNVTWFSTTFDHQHKKYLFDTTTKLYNKFGIEMIFLHSSISYNKNISLKRILNHTEVGKKFFKNAQLMKKPDLILCAFPTIDLAYYATKYALKYKIPIIIDIRDLWPKIFFDPFPSYMHPLIKITLYPMILKTKYIFRNATALTAVSYQYLDYGLKYAQRNKSNIDQIFPLGFQKVNLSKDKVNTLENFFIDKGINKNDTILWFVGTFGKTYDLIPVIEAADYFRDNQHIKFVFTGDGEQALLWKEYARNNPNIIFTGWLNKDEIIYIGNIASIGLMAYKQDAPQGLPNKIFEYMAYGLPILSSLKGETKMILQKYRIGFTYHNTNELIKYIQQLVKDKNLYSKMSVNCEKVFQKEYNSEKVYANMADYLYNIVNKGKGINV